MPRNLARYRKFIVAILSAAAVVAAEIPPDAPGWLTGAFAVLGALGVLAVRNDQRPTRRADLRQRLEFDRPKPAEPTTYGRRGKDDLEGPPRRHVRGDRPPGRGEDPPGSVP